MVLRRQRTGNAIVQQGDRIGQFIFRGFDGASYINGATVRSEVEGIPGTNNIPANLTFLTTSGSAALVERMRLTNSGNLGIGTQTPTHLIQLSGGAYSDGTVWTDASSRALKENIRELSTEEATRTLQDLTPVKYNYKTDKEDKHVGFIAEDVPELVAQKDRKGLSPMDIVAVLTKVVQEKSQVIDKQQKTIDELAAAFAQMKAEMQRLESMHMSARAEER
jgi:hypothetical protein